MSARPLSTAIKCLELLDVVAAQPGALRIADAARLIGETPATTYQRLLTLTAAGWLEKLDDGAYRLSMRACRIADAVLEQAGFGERATPAMQALADRTGESCSLVMLENDSIVIAQRIESRGALRADPRVGTELSFRDSASGRIWLAFGPASLAGRLRRRRVRLASQKEVAAVRRDGYAVGGGGDTLAGVGVVSVPILNGQDRCLASLSIVCPDVRFDLDRLLPALTDTANDIVAAQSA